jgi:glutathione S-transferase
LSDIILHHYPESAFAEKVRAMLGHKNLSWKSVKIPIIMPKPDLTALTGGYRRTPVMQIGADVYCDTALIAELLERIAPENSLFPDGQAGVARTVAQWGDSFLFMAAINYFYQAEGMDMVVAQWPKDQVEAFHNDRNALLGGKGFPSLGECEAVLSLYLQRLQDMLADGRKFLLGDAACVADFACYHPLWFIQMVPPVAGILQFVPLVLEWMERIREIGHGTSTDMTSMDAIAVAKAECSVVSDIVPGDVSGIAVGDRVAIMPNDYGFDPVEGELVLLKANEMALRREDERAGTVTVHFPRIGYQIRKL